MHIPKIINPSSKLPPQKMSSAEMPSNKFTDLHKFDFIAPVCSTHSHAAGMFIILQRIVLQKKIKTLSDLPFVDVLSYEA